MQQIMELVDHFVSEVQRWITKRVWNPCGVMER